jgi:hypothetical protein
MALLLPDLPMQLELHSLLLLEIAKWEEAPSGRDSLARLAPVKLEALQEEDPLAKANRFSVKEDLDLRQTEQRLALVRRPAARARLKDSRLRRAERFPVPSARARQYSKDPGPCASSPEIPGARKCNRAARCGGRPIFARYRRRRNQRGLAGCDNRRSHSPRKRAGLAQPFPIVAGDKRRCRPLPFAD